MNILLINPPRKNEIVGNNPPIIDDERGYNPPLGLLYMAAYLEKHSPHKVTVIDTQVDRLSYEALKQRITDTGPDIVGITAMTLTLIDVIKTAQLVKEVDAVVPVVLGGPHPHIYPKESLALPGVDYVIQGEGEVSFARLVAAHPDPEALKKVPGLVFTHQGKIIYGPVNSFITALDQLPFPARHLTPYQKYSSLLAKRRPVTTMFTSRGCPYQCAFCDRPHLGKSFRAHSAGYVVDEMASCAKSGIHEILIYDDTFTVQQQRVLDICDEVLRRKLDIGWDIRARVDTVTPDMLNKLKQAGCERIHYGVEAGTQKILQVLNKGITLEQVRDVFTQTRKAGIETLAYFMIGAPTETREDILQTIAFVQGLPADFVHVTIFTPFPATQLYQDGLRQGVLLKDVWQTFAANPSPHFQPPYWAAILSRDELRELLTLAYKRFYTRPGYIVRALMRMRSRDEFFRKMKAGLKVLGMS